MKDLVICAILWDPALAMIIRLNPSMSWSTIRTNSLRETMPCASMLIFWFCGCVVRIVLVSPLKAQIFQRASQPHWLPTPRSSSRHHFDSQGAFNRNNGSLRATKSQIIWVSMCESLATACLSENVFIYELETSGGMFRSSINTIIHTSNLLR